MTSCAAVGYPTSALGWLGVAYCTLGRLTEALALLREAVVRSPKRAMFQYWLAAAHGQLGDAEAAQTQARAVLALQPLSRSLAPPATRSFQVSDARRSFP